MKGSVLYLLNSLLSNTCTFLGTGIEVGGIIAIILATAIITAAITAVFLRYNIRSVLRSKTTYKRIDVIFTSVFDYDILSEHD